MSEHSRGSEHSRRWFLQHVAVGAGAVLAPASLRSVVAATSAADRVQLFLAATRAGDLPTVRRLLDSTPQLLRTTDREGRSAYALAHLEGHRAVGDHLRAMGFLADAHEAALAQDWERFATLTAEDVSVVNREHPIGGSTMYAAAVGGAGADLWRVYAVTGDPNRMSSGASPLQAALRFRDLPTAEVTAATLLANAADPNPPSSADLPPLHIAAERGSEEMVEMLVRLGADVLATDNRRRTAGRTAASQGHTRIVAMLERHAEIARSHSTSRSAFDVEGKPYEAADLTDVPLVERQRFVGASHRNLDYVREALREDSRMVHSVATTSEISVEACAHTGRREIVECLLEHGAPYSLPTAAMRNDTSRVKQLLDQDPARIHERGAHDFPLLWYPVIGDCGVDMMELLLARGAEIEGQHFLGTTALHWACRRGPIELVEFLIDNGADVNRRGRKFEPAGQTPLETARNRDQTAIARLLISRGAES